MTLGFDNICIYNLDLRVDYINTNANENPIEIIINNKNIELSDTAPVVENGRTEGITMLFPLTFYFYES